MKKLFTSPRSFHQLRLSADQFNSNLNHQLSGQDDRSPRRFASNKQTSLKWVVKSIEKLAEEHDGPTADATLVMTLNQLLYARTQAEVAELGRILDSLEIHRTEPFAVQERVIKALAIVGLVWLALELLDNMIDQGYLPSPIAYIAVCNSLRQMGRIRRIEKLLFRLGELSQRNPHGANVDIVALNCFLAALCDEATGKGVSSSQQKRPKKLSSLETALKWLEPGMVQGVLGAEPDVTSYTTLLSAAASVGNLTLADEVWKEMQSYDFEPNIYAYNSRLQALANNGEAGEAEMLTLFDRLLREPTLQPDQYTIDLLLVPLIRAGRVGDIDSLIGAFIERNSNKFGTVSNAFASFLNTLVKSGELSTAQALFDTYLVPAEKPDVSTGRARPGVRHFNIMIEGYRHETKHQNGEVDSKEDYTNNQTSWLSDDVEDSSKPVSPASSVYEARRQARSLYRALLDSGLRPDAYTLTSMVGVASNGEELTLLCTEAINRFHVEVTPAVLRAVVTRYGDVGDASSACWFFDKFGTNSMKARTWNALLAALASGSRLNSTRALAIKESIAAQGFSSAPTTPDLSIEMEDSSHGRDEEIQSKVYATPLVLAIDHKTCIDATRTLLDAMTRHADIGQALPKPNSQTYCIAVSAFQYGPADVDSAMNVFRLATKTQFAADGRFINAIFRCFGDDIDGAINAWKNEIRRACLAHEYRTRNAPVSISRPKGKNLIAAYHGLLYVCGRSLRPDIAVRLVYAMNKEGLDPNDTALNCYRSGKRMRRKLMCGSNKLSTGDMSRESRRLGMGAQYEAILQVECSKYDTNDKRRESDKRIRIIV